MPTQALAAHCAVFPAQILYVICPTQISALISKSILQAALSVFRLQVVRACRLI